MKCEWKKCTLADIGTIITGKTPATKNPEYWNGNIPFVTPRDIQVTKSILSTERYISNQGMQFVKGAKLPPKSICVSCIGNIGYVGMTTEECISNQQINSIVVNKNNDPDFIFYLMKYLWSFFKNYEGQSTTLSILNKTQFSKISVDVPPLTIQKRISAILSTLDDKIELNNKINANLQQQAQAIFKQNFPYNIKDVLPKGWKIGCIADIAEIHDSLRIPLSGAEREKMKNKIFPYYGAASLIDYVDEFIFDGKYLLLGEDGTVIDSAGFPILQYVWGKFWVNNHAHILTGKRGFNVESLYLLFSQTSVKSIVTGAVQPKINQANLKALQIVVPPEEKVIFFNELIEPLFAQIRQNEDQNKFLSELRDILLPKLMSGEIDVSNLIM